MKRLLILTCLVLFTASPAWADSAPNDAETVPAAAPAGQFLPAPDWASDEGGCQLPDLEGLSEEEAKAVIQASGMEVTNTAAAACPVAFSCNSIGNCAAGSLCSVSDIGQCCTTSGGLGLCCVTGTIKVKTCPCVCTGILCAVSCANSANVKWGCR